MLRTQFLQMDLQSEMTVRHPRGAAAAAPAAPGWQRPHPAAPDALAEPLAGTPRPATVDLQDALLGRADGEASEASPPTESSGPHTDPHAVAPGVPDLPPGEAHQCRSPQRAALPDRSAPDRGDAQTSAASSDTAARNDGARPTPPLAAEPSAAPSTVAAGAVTGCTGAGDGEAAGAPAGGTSAIVSGSEPALWGNRHATADSRGVGAAPTPADVHDGRPPEDGSGGVPRESSASVSTDYRAVKGTGPQRELRAMQVLNCYLVVETPEGLTLIDQHALHERILYEYLRPRVLEGQLETQRLLVPRVIELSPKEAALLVAHRELLRQLGLEIEPFGNNTVALTAYPAILKRAKLEQIVRDVAERLDSAGRAPSRRDLLDALLQMMSCKAAIKAGQRLTEEEIEALLRQRHLIDDAHHCPHGRPTALVLSQAELDRQFGRLG
ncbi:MAG: hypothetical protein D6725_10480 [Planctomycetota bacterium]|nr:MAG: hypothetical protein D6725_10480 [Planctomycetota bacterium]